MPETSGEAFLDGYRCGLGAAIRSIDTVTKQVPELCEPEATQAILRGIIAGLRTISASVTLAEEPADD